MTCTDNGFEELVFLPESEIYKEHSTNYSVRLSLLPRDLSSVSSVSYDGGIMDSFRK